MNIYVCCSPRDREVSIDLKDLLISSKLYSQRLYEVQLVGNVYRQATKNIVWLELSDEDVVALHVVEQLTKTLLNQDWSLRTGRFGAPTSGRCVVHAGEDEKSFIPNTATAEV